MLLPFASSGKTSLILLIRISVALLLIRLAAAGMLLLPSVVVAVIVTVAAAAWVLSFFVGRGVGG
jgi:hypothetical protein